jgi:uncharacterized protein involved in outer membrane biogenesis
VKKILSTILILLMAVVIVTLIVIGECLDHIVEKAVRTYGPQMTQTSVTVDSIHLSLMTGSANIKGLVIGNPKGYQTVSAISAGTIAVGVDPMSVFSKKIVIHTFRLEAPEITFEGGLGGNNLSQIMDNVNSAGKSNGTVSTNAAVQPAQSASPGQPAQQSEPTQTKAGKKLEVDDLLITNAQVHVLLTGMQGQQTLTLPPIHLTDLGKDGDGITAADLSSRVLNAITSATLKSVATDASILSKDAASLKQIGQDAAKQSSNTLNNAVNNLLNAKH